MLEFLGLRHEVDDVYQRLLASPEASTHDIAESLELPDGEVDTAMAELLELGLLRQTNGGVVPVQPDDAIAALIQQQEAQIARATDALAAARDRLSQYVDTFVAGRTMQDDHGLVESIPSADVVRSRLYQLVCGARKTLVEVLPGPAVPREALAWSGRLDRIAVSHGVIVRYVVAEPGLSTSYWREHLETQSTLGIKVRMLPSPPCRVLVTDDEVAVVPMQQGPGAYILHGAALVHPLTVLFEELWHSARVLEPGDDAMPSTEITDARVRMALRLLAEGHKDETIARRMGLSVRTVRRLVAVAIERLGADSRFQAGVLAVRGGWLD